MRLDQIALQLVSFSSSIQTDAGLRAVCRQVRDLGYRAVQVSGIYDAPLTVAEIRGACVDAGLTICATHEKGAAILQAPAAIAQRLVDLDTACTAYPYPAGLDLADPAVVDGLADGLSAAGRVLHGRGRTLCYHNHQIEFQRLGAGTVMDRLFQRADPAALAFELDVYWLQLGGQDPVAWCRRCAGRLPLIHLADYQVGPDGNPRIAALGDGVLDLRAIVAAATDAGCAWFIVEHWQAPDPVASAARSLAHLSTLAD
jgi:sugar phosphate isomerase/epimerase